MGDLLVFCEQHDGAVGASSLGLLEEAARMAASLGAHVDAVVCGHGLDDAQMAARRPWRAHRLCRDDEALRRCRSRWSTRSPACWPPHARRRPVSAACRLRRRGGARLPGSAWASW
jgi:hypothetical protein